MPISKDKKKEILAGLKDSVGKASSLVFVNFHGLTVSEVTEVRKKLRKEGIGYTVAKKTLMKKALDEAKIEGTLPELAGEIALAFGQDPIAPAREIFAFQKKFDKKLSMVGGVFENKFMDKMQIMEIASIPGRETLYAQFVNLINSPIQRFVVVIDAIAKSKPQA